MGESVRDAFLREAGETGAWGAGLDGRLDELVEAGVSAHPELEVSAGALAAAIGRAVRGEDLEPALSRLRPADLALACACAEADPRALVKFEREYGLQVDLAVARVPNLGMDPDDFRQRVREKLFTAGAGEKPRIGAYSGRGSLRAWVRVTAMRLALDLTRRRAEPQNRVSDDGDLVDRIAGGTDPELAFMRSRFGAELKALLVAGVEAMSPRGRNLLRYHYLHGLPARRIAEMYAVHRATAFKWLDEARGDLLDRIGALAEERLGVGREEIRSIVALLGSRLDLSVRHLIGSKIEPEGA